MRPIRLTMSAFGSYADKEVIDFSGMEQGIFLVTGDTGSGKTTIFDAIVYALYDRTSGGVRDGNMMRSAYADLRTPTFVELIFSCKDEIYTIIRNPDYERESLRKDKDGNPKKTQEKSKAELILPDGSAFRGNKKQINQKIEELLGMDARQFLQMAMIAQGDFLKLIHAKSEERREIFSKLFDTGIYGKVQEELRRQEKEYFVLVKDKENACREQISRIICPEETEEGEELERLKSSLDLNAAIELLDRLSISGKAKEEELLEQKKELEQKILLAGKAKELLERIQGTRVNLQKCRGWLDENLPKEDMFREQEKQAASAWEYKKEELAVFDNAFNKVLEEQKMKIQEMNEVCSSLYALKKLWDRKQYGKKLQDNEALAWQEANALYQNVCKHYDAVYDAFLLNQAGILAKGLSDGMACPVCGSTIHPQTAALPEYAPDQNQVKAARTEVKKAEGMRDAKQTAFQNAVREYQISVGGLKQEGMRLFGADFDTESELWFQKSMDAVIQAETDLSKCKKVYGEKELTGRKKRVELCNEFELCKKNHQTSRNVLETFIRQTERVQGEKRILEEQEAALLTEWKEQHGASDDLTEEVLQKLIEKYKTVLDGLKTESDIIEKGYREIYVRNQSNNKTKEVLWRYQKEYGKLKEQFTLIRHLSQTAGGSLAGSARLDFESYVQRQYFEKIIQYANQRLLQMSSGQFLLRSRKLEDLKKVGKVGLDLDVYSLVTESERDVKTLSGGESFMAALCMALGMADVIQDHSGAIRLDTMFIDEGFGSLDEHAREQAIQVLYRLAGEKRLIGIISHVTELKDQIESRLVVKKSKKGSHVIWQKS